MMNINKIPKDSVLLFSGGLDSFIAWRLLKQPKALYFAIGHKAEQREIACLKRIKERFGGNMPYDCKLLLGKYEMENGYIPYRNLFFIMLASLYSPNIILAQTLEWAPDKNRSFYRKVERLLKEMNMGVFQGLVPKKIKIWTPFANYTKTELVSEYCKRYDSTDLTNYTVSCYSGKEKNCGKCDACLRRYVAMKNNGIEEEYEVSPDLKVKKQKWSIKDFRFSNIKMYIKRYLEMRKYLK